MKDLKTLCDLLFEQNKIFSRKDFLNYEVDGKLKSFSHQTFFNNALHLACALNELGLKKGSSFANFSYQNPTWLMVDFGAILAGLVTVPIFHNISSKNLLFQIDDSASKAIFCDDLSLIDLEEIHKSKIKIIYANKNDKSLKKFNAKQLFFYDDLLKMGKELVPKYGFDKLSKRVKSNDLATIIYTSGSTGDPKGVEITHANLISQINSTKYFFPLGASDVAISYLPLAHIFERMVMTYYISQGIKIYFVDDVKKIGAYLQKYQPTLMTTVPRVLEKFFQAIDNSLDEASFIKKTIAKAAINRALTKDIDARNSLLDKIFEKKVYQKLRQVMGGKMNMVICGGAMISEDMERFFTNVGLDIYPGYGMTETSPVIAANCPRNYRFRSVGKLYPGVEIKIEKDRELLVKGPNVMRCYHNREELTKKVISKNGWLRTGDLAEIDNDGFLKIVGRKKELFKTSYGKYIAPVPIEQKIVQYLGFLIGALIIAEGKNFASILLFPEFETIQRIKDQLNSSDKSDKEFLESKTLQDFIQNKIDKINNKLDKWERVQKFIIIKDNISIEGGEITPSMKLKRGILEQKYKSQIDQIYS